MKTQKEFYDALYERAKWDAKSTRLLIELFFCIPIAIGLCFLIFYIVGRISPLMYFPVFVLLIVFFFFGLARESITKVSEKKIMKRFDKIIKEKQKYYPQAIEAAEREIGLAQNRWRDLDHEKYLLDKVILDRFDYANPKKE